MRGMVQNSGPGASPLANGRGDRNATESDGATRHEIERIAIHTDSPLLLEQAPTFDLTDTQSDGQRPARDKRRTGDPRIPLLQTQCLKLSLSILARPGRHARSLAFTSAIPGEGKSFLATLTASSLASKSHKRVILVDCNWENATLHTLYDLPPTPGLAEWLRHECTIDQIRHSVSPYLTVIPAGDAFQDAVILTDTLRAMGPHTLLTTPDETLVVDLPPVLTSAYGAVLSQQFDAVLLVVRSGVTRDVFIQEACRELSASAVEGVVLNATRSRIPRWLQRVL